MLEALVILTTLDAVTRVGRYLLQDALGAVWRPLGDTRNLRANVAASGLMVTGWGYFLIQGVRDPLGGINSLWPLFGIANQLLAAIALLPRHNDYPENATWAGIRRPLPRPRMAAAGGGLAGRCSRWLPTLVPLVWLLAVTMTAGCEKIFDPDPRIGFLAAAKGLETGRADLEHALAAAKSSGTAEPLAAAADALQTNRVLRFNNLLDASVAGFFILMVVLITLLSGVRVASADREKAGRRLCAKRSRSGCLITPSRKGKPLRVFGLLALGLALAKELTGEAHMERARNVTAECDCRGLAGTELERAGEGKDAHATTPGRHLHVEIDRTEIQHGVNLGAADRVPAGRRSGLPDLWAPAGRMGGSLTCGWWVGTVLRNETLVRVLVARGGGGIGIPAAARPRR